ncbi:hypothetical protein C8Q72DRAFT_751927, partial [Fomitopsis betulina]
CNACNEWFEMMQGLMAHQSMSKKCSWYKKGKLKVIFEPSPEQQAKSEDVSASQSSRVHNDVELREEDEEEEDFDEDLAFVQVPGPSASRRQPQAGPSQQTQRRTAIQLDDNEDTRVEDIDETAGEVIGNRETVREDWRRHFSLQAGEKRASRKRKDDPDSKLWHPFESELDWQVGFWAINEEVHKGAVDRLLSIPGFCEKLGLSYHNMRALTSRLLLRSVDSMPARAEWKEEWLTFKDQPGERHLVQFCDIIEAIRALLGNPAHTDRIVYRPSKLFSSSARDNRIYTEMWTGKW